MKPEELELQAILRAKTLPMDLQRIAYATIDRAMQCYQAGTLSEGGLSELLDRPRPCRRVRYSAGYAGCLR